MCTDRGDETTSEGQMASKTDLPHNKEYKSSDSCRITTIPKNAYVYDRYEPEIFLEIGDIIPNNSFILFGCERYQLFIGEKYNYCINGAWSQDFPTCKPLCSPEKLSSISFKPTCKYQRKKVPCAEPAEPGTTAKVACNEQYESFQAEEQTSVCGMDGRWYPEPSGCNQVCGSTFDKVCLVNVN